MANRGSSDASVRSPSPEIPESDDIVTEEALRRSSTSSSAGHAAAHAPTAGKDDEEALPGEGDSARDWVRRSVQLGDHAKLKQVKQKLWSREKSLRNPVLIGDGTVELEESDRLILEMVGREIESNEHLSNCSMFNKTRDYSSNSKEESSDSQYRSIIKNPRWNVRILDSQIHPDPWPSTRKYDSAHAAIKKRMVSMYIGVDFTEDDARKIANAVCRLLERWPNLDEIIANDYKYAKQSRRHAFRDLALYYAVPEHPRQVSTIQPTSADGGFASSYGLRVRFLTGRGTMTHFDSVPLSVSDHDVDLSSEPPSLPPNIEVFFREQTQRNASDADKSDRAAGARRAIHIVVFIANQLHN
ncbi:hypothetical protein KC351_g3496 [Hortaea werneckii]|nr:hypothetical protein KC351_g3496 [Hortaea werneckii]